MNNSIKAKGLDGLSYDAVGERAVHSLEAYGQDQPVYNNNIHTISSIYYGGTLKMYGHSIAQPNGPETRPEYYMHQLDVWGMTGNQKKILEGAIAFKNAVANKRVRGRRNCARKRDTSNNRSGGEYLG
ncbi:MAG: hypothetical protein M1840_009117 [Geoglossum simile]|nr:MAG: hypothetical protein M1840_009117 [Geoglossum simile]